MKNITLRKAARNSGKFLRAVEDGIRNTFGGIYTVELSLSSVAHEAYVGRHCAALELRDINGKLVSSKAISLTDIASGNGGREIGRSWGLAIVPETDTDTDTSTEVSLTI